MLVGCIADGTPSSSGGTGYGSAGGSSSGAGTPQTLLADVDTAGRFQSFAGGQGIGIYVEYDAGGHWTLSWTCDTSVTNLVCTYLVDASVSADNGTIQNAVAVPPSGMDSLRQTSPLQVEAVTTTTTGVDQITFDTTPGATLTVAVQLNAPVSFFFVQDGKVNGGYTGQLTNPMMFLPTAP